MSARVTKTWRTFDWRNRCTLQLHADWYDEHVAGIGLSYGLDGCDSVWDIGIEIEHPPHLIARWLDRRWDRRVKAGR